MGGSTRPPSAPRRRRPSKTSPDRHRILTNELHRGRNFVAVDDLAKFTPGLRTLVNDGWSLLQPSPVAGVRRSEPQRLPSPMQSKYGTLPSLAAVDRVEIMQAPPASSTAPASWGA